MDCNKGDWRARLRLVRGALSLGAAWALAACAPLPVAPPPGDAPMADESCRVHESGAFVCPPAAGDVPAPRSSRSRRTAQPSPPAAAPAAVEAPSAEAPSEPLRDSDQQGLASWYGPGLHGRRTASGERFDRYELTAAHRTLPFGSRVCVRSSVTGKTVVVRINDRGPFTGGRVIDLSQGAAQELGMTGLGIKPVELWLLGKDEEACPDALLDASALDGAVDDPEAEVAAQPVARKKIVSGRAKVVPKSTSTRARNTRRP